jgi:hypothetical protein
VLSRGVIHNVDTVDVRIPKGYSSFQLRFVETNLSASDGFYFIVSYDGGTTFLSDATNYDTYSEVSTLAFQYPVGTQIFTGGSDLGGTPAPDAWRAHIHDPASQVGGLQAAFDSFDYYMEITPGNNNQYFKAMIQLVSSTIYSGFNGGVGAMRGFFTLSAHSTVPNPKGRINLMRFGAYFGALTGYGTNKILSGQWYLLAIGEDHVVLNVLNPSDGSAATLQVDNNTVSTLRMLVCKVV